MAGRIGRTYKPVLGDIKLAQYRIASSDIEAWKQAITSARSTINPRRKALYELYDSIMLDGHITSVAEKRVKRITNKRPHFSDKNAEGEVDQNILENVIATPWFYKMTEFAMDAKAWGHSLIELTPKAGVIDKAVLIPRINVSPENGLVLYDYMDTKKGLDYRNDPFFSKHLIEVGTAQDYGKIMQAAQYVIYKRGGFGDWSQFAELFGMPFREGNYQPYDNAGRVKLEDALSKMGGAGYIVTPEGTSIKFHDNNGTGKSEVFKDLIEICNKEISKIFLSNTMTTEDGSSRSQSEVHQDSEDDLTLSDMIEMEYLLNWDIKEKFVALGIPVGNGNFFYPETESLPMEKRIDVDVKLSEKIAFPEEYWYKTYGIPKPTGDATPIDANKKPAPKTEEEQAAADKTAAAMAKLSKSMDKVTSLYKQHDCAQH